MKQNIITKRLPAVLLISGIFMGCNNSPTSPYTQSPASPDTGLTASMPWTPTDLAQNGTTAPAPNTATQGASQTSPTTATGQNADYQNGINCRVARTTHRTASRHIAGRIKKSRTLPDEKAPTSETPVAVETESNIEAPAPAIPPQEPQPQPVTYEQQTEYTGNVQPAVQEKRMNSIRFGFEGGFNLNDMYMSAENYKTSNSPKAGFHAGVLIDAPLGDHLAIQPGLRYIMKGGELHSTSANALMSQETKDKLTLHYIELPANLVYKAGKPGNTRFMIGAGPYLSYLVNAQDKTKVTTTYTDGGQTVSEGQHRVPVGNNDQTGNMRTLDAGAGGFIGVETCCGMFIKAGGELGLIDLQKSQIDNKYYNRNYDFQITLGYLLGCTK